MQRFGPSVLVLLIGSLVTGPGADVVSTNDGRGIGIVPGNAPRSGPENKWALVIGINDYTSLPKLRYARQDAETLAKILVERCGFRAEQVILMTDSPEVIAKDIKCYPSRGNLRTRINQMATFAGKNDLLIICFAGHGLNLDGQGYLAPADGEASDSTTLIPLTWVKTTLETSGARDRLLILDACHAGAREAGKNSTARAGTPACSKLSTF